MTVATRDRLATSQHLRDLGYPGVADMMEDMLSVLGDRADSVWISPQELRLHLGLPELVLSEYYSYKDMELRFKWNLHDTLNKEYDEIQVRHVVVTVGYTPDHVSESVASRIHPHMPNDRSNLRDKMCISGAWWRTIVDAFEMRDWRTVWGETISAASTYNPRDAYRRINAESRVEETNTCEHCDRVMDEDNTYFTESGSILCGGCSRICEGCGAVDNADYMYYTDDSILLCESCYDHEARVCDMCHVVLYYDRDSFYHMRWGMMCPNCHDQLRCDRCGGNLEAEYIEDMSESDYEGPHTCLQCEDELEQEEEE